MKKLQKVLLINWLYFSKTCIDLGDINFLTGKNAAGKSTVIDALQIVLLGELNEKNFNKAANGKANRTLNGYLRADMDATSAKNRTGKEFTSYIACEFYDDVEMKHFVLGIVFDCHADGARNERFFHYNGQFPENQFVENGHPLGISALNKYMKAIPKSQFEMPVTQREYRANILAKFNIHNEQYFRMMKKAVSFSPIDDIQKFITENICDAPQKPDLEEMQATIQDYKKHEQMAKRQEDKVASLTEICDAFRVHNQILDRLTLQKFIVLFAEKEAVEQEIKQLEENRAAYKTSLALEVAAQVKLDAERTEKTARKEQLTKDHAKDEVFQERERLAQKIEALQREKKNLAKMLETACTELKVEAHRLRSLCERVSNLFVDDSFSNLYELANQMKRYISRFSDCGEAIFAQDISSFAEITEMKTGLVTAVREVQYKLGQQISEWQEEQVRNRTTLRNLERNVKDYPDGLRALQTRLKDALAKQGCRNVEIEILADVLELKQGEDAWRGAVEGYLNTQKFYLLVSPEHYADALKQYNQWKHEYGGHSFGLVDIEKLRKNENLMPAQNSLAHKIETQNAFARSYIDYLLGRVICCGTLSELRNHKVSITAEGMLYQGYVSRPLSKARMEDSFIGRSAIALRIARLQGQQDKLAEQLVAYETMAKALESDTFESGIFSTRYLEVEVPARLNDYTRQIALNKELAETNDKYDACDLSWANELQHQIDVLTDELEAMGKQQMVGQREIWRLEDTIKRWEFEDLPEKYQRFTEKQDALGEQYSDEYQNSVGLPRYEKEVQRLHGKPATLVKNFLASVAQSENAVHDAYSKLRNLREQYVRTFQPCRFTVDTLENDEFENERRSLEESLLPEYREKIRHAKESALEQFQNDFLAKLRGNIQSVEKQIKELNKALKQAQFGTDRYEFRMGKNPDYSDYYEMILSAEFTSSDGGLFSMEFQQKYAQLAENLFSQITSSDDTVQSARKQSDLEANIARYTDFRTYLKFDLATTDQNGSTQLLSQTLHKKSGGETQTPFYIAVLASFAQLYRVNEAANFTGNTMRLVVFDEAFNKMDSDRIIESVKLLRKMGLQAIVCTPPDKIPDIMPEADTTLYVHKEGYQMSIVPYAKEMK